MLEQDTSDNVVSFKGKLPEMGAQSAAVEILETALARAKAGDMTAIALSYVVEGPTAYDTFRNVWCADRTATSYLYIEMRTALRKLEASIDAEEDECP